MTDFPVSLIMKKGKQDIYFSLLQREKQMSSKKPFSGDLDHEMDGQQTFAPDDNMNMVVKNDETRPDIVDENGNDATETALELIKGGRFNAKMFHEQYEDNTENVLYALLSMQSNNNPLKKGGDSIAFRCNAIIIQNRQNYTVPQNTLLDIITARMSSRPEDSYYIITAKEMIDELPFEDKTYVYRLMSKTCKELNRSPFIFEIDLDNGKKKELEFQWNEVLMYNGGENLDDDEDAYISFKPTKFFRILTLSSTIMHGAHYPVGVSAQISSKYARNLFYYLEDMKNYREYPNATPGVFTLSMEELQYIVKYPASYRPTDVRRAVLDMTVDAINSAKGIDFAFNYELIKTRGAGRKRKITHVRFIISKVIESKQEVVEIEEKEDHPDAMDEAALQVLKGAGLTEDESRRVLKKYKANNRDLIFLTQAITSVATTKNVKSKCAVLCHIMDNGLNADFSEEENKKRDTETKKTKNTFNNFNQREYDYDQLEKDLLSSKPDQKK